MSFKIVHRYLSLAFAALWLFQAVTGCLVVFRWELDDARVAGRSQPFDVVALGARLDQLSSQTGTTVSSVWSSGAKADRFDISYSRNGKDYSLRVDGAGHDLRNIDHTTIFDTFSDLHMALMQGDIGRWFLGFSGLLLLTNMALGVKLAWPRAGMWLKAMRPPRATALPTIIYGWHRMLGLWLVIPALVTISAGVLLAYDDPIEAAFKANVPVPVHAPVVTAQIKPSVALKAVMTTYPDSTLSGFSFADLETPWYKARLHAKGEMPRIWGMTTVFVSAQTGEVLSTYDARLAHAPARFLLDVIYPLHTGQIAGVFGRMVQLLIGLWLIAMIGLGVGLWWVRRHMGTKKSRA